MKLDRINKDKSLFEKRMSFMNNYLKENDTKVYSKEIEIKYLFVNSYKQMVSFEVAQYQKDLTEAKNKLFRFIPVVKEAMKDPTYKNNIEIKYLNYLFSKFNDGIMICGSLSDDLVWFSFLVPFYFSIKYYYCSMINNFDQ